MKPVDGAVLLDKPEGISSFKALTPVKRGLRGSKVGHTGTLDPFASGLMVVLCGRMTKLASQLTNLDKTYEAVFCFGTETDTLDPEGQIVGEGSVPAFDRISKELERFTGTFLQRPPAYSAVHVDGKRAYERARSGETVELPERSVSVREIETLDWRAPKLRVRVTVSSGTYIRSIARDLGYACDTVAYVSALRRVSVGAWQVRDAVRPDEFAPETDLISAARTVASVPGLRRAVVVDSAVQRVCNGMPLRAEWLRFEERRVGGNTPADEVEGDVALFDSRGELLALATGLKGKFNYRFVRPPA